MSNLKLFGYGCLGLVGLAGLGIVGSTLFTASSVITAPGRVISKTLETNNIVSSYERFRDLNQAFTARAAQVRQFKTLVGDETDAGEKRRLRIEVAAVQQSCRDIAARYNADASKMNKVIFRSDAPESLDPSNCE